MDIAEMHAELAEIDNKLIELKDRQNDLRHQLADELCPFIVGDRVSDGKSEYEVSAIVPKSYKPFWELRGAKIKKDGTPGKITSSYIYSFRSEITKVG